MAEPVEITEEMIDAAYFRSVASIEPGQTGWYVEPGAYDSTNRTINLQGRCVSRYPVNGWRRGYRPIRRSMRDLGYVIDGVHYTKTYLP